jgi:hypothetical protein
MRLYKSLFTLLTSTYLSNARYNNNVAAYLRLFFERNTKLTSPAELFGNVFRNSKWSDLKKINIKVSFWETFINTLLLTICGLFVLMLFLGKTKAAKYLGFIPMFTVLDSTLSLLCMQFSDLWVQASVTAFTLYSALRYWFLVRLHRLKLWKKGIDPANKRVLSIQYHQLAEIVSVEIRLLLHWEIHWDRYPKWSKLFWCC